MPGKFVVLVFLSFLVVVADFEFFLDIYLKSFAKETDGF